MEKNIDGIITRNIQEDAQNLVTYYFENKQQMDRELLKHIRNLCNSFRKKKQIVTGINFCIIRNGIYTGEYRVDIYLYYKNKENSTVTLDKEEWNTSEFMKFYEAKRECIKKELHETMLFIQIHKVRECELRYGYKSLFNVVQVIEQNVLNILEIIKMHLKLESTFYVTYNYAGSKQIILYEEKEEDNGEILRNFYE